LRRKPFLLSYETLMLFFSLAALLTANIPVQVGATILAGFGRGANGAAGLSSSAEQAFLAEQVEAGRRGFVYSLNTAVACLLAGSPGLPGTLGVQLRLSGCAPGSGDWHGAGRTARAGNQLEPFPTKW
jgi:hypothetical protein